MLRLAWLAIALAFAAVSVRSFVGVTGLWPIETETDASIVATAARTELAGKPISAASFYALGVAADKSGEIGRARDLMAHSLALDPRLRAARLWALSDAVRGGRADEATSQAQVLARLSPDAVPAVSIILVGLIQDGRARRLIGERLKNQPLALATAAQAVKAGVGGEAVMELLTPSDLARMPNGIERAQSLVATSFIRVQRFAQARRAWYKLAGLSPAHAVFDGEFEGLAGSPPFGWTLRSDADVETEIEQSASGGGALKVTAFGSLPVIAAEQTIVLDPGNHVLSFEASSNDQAVGETPFAWQITCISGQLLTEVLVETAGPEWSVGRRSFNVPSGCPAQILRLTKLRTPNDQERFLKLRKVAVT